MNMRATTGSRRLLWRTALLCLALPVGLAGCGGPKLAPVSGKVTCNGEPVTGGTLIFHPVNDGGGLEAGAPASAEVHADGSYTLSTNRLADGAMVGRHHVGYTPPQQTLTEQQRTDRSYVAPRPLTWAWRPTPATWR